MQLVVTAQSDVVVKKSVSYYINTKVFELHVYQNGLLHDYNKLQYGHVTYRLQRQELLLERLEVRAFLKFFSGIE